MSTPTTPSRLTALGAGLAERYRLERELGAGGMATVYLAEDLKHHRRVAIKVLHPELSAVLGPERFLKEIELTANLQHPHILPLFDSGSADGLLYYVMPYVDGETLRGRLERDGQLPIADAVRIATETADALQYAHQRGVIHRDIKPENILLQNGHALVADFGIALAVEQAGGVRMTQTGLSLGTPQYMAPEQAMGDRHVGPRADIYALGAVTYEMLAGEAPFTGPNGQAIIAKVITEDAPSMRARRRSVPAHVDAAVSRALEKLPADRWVTAHEFDAALRDPTVGAVHVEARAERPRAAAAARALRTSAVALACAALILGVAIGWVALRIAGTPAADPRVTVMSILPPAGGNFSEQQSLALSPDGRKLAFVFAALDGTRTLWVRDLAKLDATPIPGTPGADVPFWSPDGRSLGFFANGQLQVVDPSGDIRKLCSISGPNGGSWSADGLIVFTDRHGVSTVPAGGGPCRTIVPGDTVAATNALLLPDGKRILYSRGRYTDMAVADRGGKPLGTLPVQTVIFAISAPDHLIYPDPKVPNVLDFQRVDFAKLALVGSPVPLVTGVRSRGGIHTFAFSTNGALAYLPGGDDPPYLFYSPNGTADTIPIGGTWTVAERPKRAGPPTIAFAGNRVGIWLYDVASGRATRVPVNDTTLSTPGEGIGATYPVFNPDGSRFAYAAGRRRRCGVAVHDLTRATDQTLFLTPATLLFGCPATQDWSPDGTHLLVRNDTALDIVTLAGSIVSRISRPGAVWEGRFSPDGRSIAYSSDETGRAEVYVQSLSGGVPTRLSLEGGRWPSWTSDGRHVVYMTPIGRVQEASLSGASAGGTVRTLFSVQGWRRSTFDDHGIGFAMMGDEKRYVVRQSPSGLAVAYVQNWPSLLSR